MDDRAKVTLPQAEVDGFKHNLTLIEKKLPTDGKTARYKVL